MAAEPVNTEGAKGDIQAHVRDYSYFTAMLKYGAIVAFVTGILVMFIIS